MKRIIKFRAWDKNEEKFREIVDFNFCLRGKLAFVVVLNNGQVEQLLLKDIILMQYTGLKDSKGKEIYEGDIIKFIHIDVNNKEEILPVIWDNGGFICKGYNTSKGVDMASGYDTIRGEIIGNIYENPELLK